jgi:hypothetical protein
MQIRKIVLLSSLALAGCGDDLLETAPVCDDIGWPLGVDPVISPPPPVFEVECADGWGNAVATRPALDTMALPGSAWISRPHPAGGWIHVVTFEHEPGWEPWLEQQGFDSASLPDGHGLLRIGPDGTFVWAVSDFGIWMAEFVGDELWALGGDEDFALWLLAFDPDSGELIDARPWDLDDRYNQLVPARDPAGGAWITGIADHEDGEYVDHHLYRATTIEAVDLVATRTTEAPRQAPSGGVHAFIDGGAAWWTDEGFEVIEPDGSVRWTHPDGLWAASGADTMLISSLIPTGVGAGEALRLDKVTLADGAMLWTREHQRFVVVQPEACGEDGCSLRDYAHPVLRPDGGYLLIGWHAYPSSSCMWQPLIMAVSSDGEAEWAHRVETCGRAFYVAFRDEARFEILGLTGLATGDAWAGAWIRSFEL